MEPIRETLKKIEEEERMKEKEKEKAPPLPLPFPLPLNKIKFTDLRFCKIKKGTKKPYEPDWPNIPYTWEEIQEHIKKEQNYGVICGFENLIIIDADSQEVRDVVEKELPPTFKVETGSKGYHYYYICKELRKKVVLQNSEKHYGEVQGPGAQCVGPGSLHPTGNTYNIINNLDIVEVSKEQLFAVLKPFMKDVSEQETKAIDELKDFEQKYAGTTDINSIEITSVIDMGGFKKANNGEWFGANPWHGCILSPDTKVFTPKGVKKITDIKVGDSVFGKDNSIVKVTQTFKNKYSGNSYIFKCGLPEIKFTEEHPILICTADFNKKHKIIDSKEVIKTEWKEAKNISIQDNIVVPKWNKRKTIYQIDKIKLTNNLAYILGKYLADGSVYIRKGWAKTQKNKEGTSYFQVSICINESKRKQAEEIIKKAKNLKIPGNIYYEKQKHTLRITLFSKWLVEFIKSTVGIYSENKRLGELVFAPRIFLDILIRAYYENDDNYSKGRQRVSSASEILIKEVQDVLFQLNVSSRYYKYNDIGKSKTKFQTNSLSWHKNPKQTSYFEDKYNFYIRIKEIIIEKVKMVDSFNIETTDNTFRVPFVVHNSTTKMNFWINPIKNLAHCWRCDCGLNVAKVIAIDEGIIPSGNCDRKLSKEEFMKVLKIAQEDYGLAKPDNPYDPIKKSSETRKRIEAAGETIEWDELETIDKFLIFDGIEKIYEIHLRGKIVKLEGKEILDYNIFRLRFFEQFGILLNVPRGITSFWAELVSGWYRNHKEYSQDKTENISDTEEAKELILDYINNAIPSDNHVLKEGIVYVSDDSIYVPTKIVKKILRRNLLNVSLRKLSYILNEYILTGSIPIKIENKSERFWKFRKERFNLTRKKLEIKKESEDA